MLRALVAVLLLANLGYWAWSAGALEAFGLAPLSERDPTRIDRQVNPDAVRLLAPAAAAAALRAASRPWPSVLACLEAGPFAPTAAEAAERALAAASLPAGSWVRVNREVGAPFAVVLGPLNGRDAVQKKGKELGRLRVSFELLDLPAADGSAAAQTHFALGRYDNRIAAEAALANFSQRGVRTARVAALRPATSMTRLRADNPTPAVAEQLRTISGAALGAGFVPCAAATTAR